MQPVDPQQWLINAGIVGTGGLAIAAAWVFKQIERKKPEPVPTNSFAVVGAALTDGRLIERLTDQLSENGRSMRDNERSIENLCRAIERMIIVFDGMRREMEESNRKNSDEEKRIFAAIEKSRGIGK